MPPLAKALFLCAAVLAVLDVLASAFAAAKLPLGHQPGDIRVERPGFRFHLPIGSSLLVSLLLTAAQALWAWLRGRRASDSRQEPDRFRRWAGAGTTRTLLVLQGW